MSEDNIKRYDRTMVNFSNWGIATIVVLYLLILAGGVVRSSGAGMGCPDWPKCFDRIVPPTHVDELPANYQEIYKNHGYGSTEFNAVKTWIEYINRLLGVLTGFFILISFGLSIKIRKSNPKIFYLMLATFILVLIQGWLGGQVVATNLHALLVSIHMVLALVIVALVIWAVYLAKHPATENKVEVPVLWRNLLIWTLVLIFVQVIIGTQVREQIDFLSVLMIDASRQSWVDSLTWRLEIHRILALPIIVVSIFGWLKVKKLNVKAGYFFGITAGLAILQVLLGVFLSYLGLPPVAQALHILVASLLVGSHFYCLLLIKIEGKKLK
ncbi:MAG: cytochrome c oxidase assembly protein subunit 15 [Sphingobacteriales bacterium]|jgi:cytochrome c oxidase assembly protein subunit 15